jgi:serine/threonine protein kinase
MDEDNSIDQNLQDSAGAQSAGQNAQSQLPDVPTQQTAAQSAAPEAGPKPNANPELALIGQEISGCVILEKISSGGMGTVFKAKHKALDRIVCVKILSPSLANDKKAVGLFLTEARAIAEIDHPNIVFVYNVGREKGFYFIVMSFIDGESLSSIVRKKPNLPLSFVVDTFIGILRGLEAAHQKGIIHRDIKPSNILINKKLEPKIVDFGIAKKVDKEKGCTKTTELAGTAYFLSPEQALGRAIDTRADLYSVGASIFYVLTGKYPFTGKNSMDIIQKHINEPVPDVSRYRRGIPTWLSAGIAKLMAKDPKDRFQTATETLLYFQKMRADDQLKVSQGVNIADEVGLKISSVEIGSSPRTDENAKQGTRNNRFNMDMTERSTSGPKASIPIMNLGDKKEGPAKLPPKRNFERSVTEDFLEARRKSLRAMSVAQGRKEGLFKRSFFAKAFALTCAAFFMLLGGWKLFYKLGTVCSGFDIAGKSFGQALIEPWIGGNFLPGQMQLAAICFVFFVFTVSMLFFNHIKRIAPIVLVVAALSYAVGLFAPDSFEESLRLYAPTFMIVYAFLLGALAINIDDGDTFKLRYRFLEIAFFGAAFLCVYQFFKPENFAQGELTASLFYSTIGLVSATFVLPFLRGSFIYRLGTILLFALGCASIWVYQSSGSAYHMINQLNLPAAAPAAKSGDSDELESRAYVLKDFVFAQLLEGAPARAEQEDVAEESQSPVKEQEAEPVLTPQETKALFLEALAKRAQTMQRSDLERQAWVFALQEPYENFKYNYKEEGFIPFTVVALIMYGLLMFMISLLETREDRWISL